MPLLDLLKVFWVSFAASAIVAWPIYRWLKSTVKQKIDPYAPETHQAKQGTPTMGGLIIVVGALSALALKIGVPAGEPDTPWAVFVLLIGFALIGFGDDFLVPRLTGKRGLGWKQKIIPEFLIAALAARLELPFGGPWFVLVFLILFFSNAFNFVDGLDGLSASVWMTLAVGLLFLAGNQAADVQPATMAISGGIAVFLILNAPPAKVFMGDVGSLPIGAILGFFVFKLLVPPSAVGLYLNPSMVVPVVILSLLMIAELVPVPMQVAYFKLTKGKRLFPATPIHHGFEKKGWPESRVTWTFALFQLLLSLAAVTVAAMSQVNAASSIRLY